MQVAPCQFANHTDILSPIAVLESQCKFDTTLPVRIFEGKPRAAPIQREKLQVVGNLKPA